MVCRSPPARGQGSFCVCRGCGLESFVGSGQPADGPRRPGPATVWRSGSGACPFSALSVEQRP
eukprot:10650992-Lingulodinium_polyedra.AAC.1